MCGIAGYWRANPGPDGLGNALKQLKHRGPDESVSQRIESHQLGIGMTRLAIVDVQNGHQPYFNESGSILAVFNGEIYNHLPLRDHLQERGHAFNSTADGETIVHLYEEYGDDFVRHLEGMFAVALFDTEKRKLLLARDRFGEKPLFYVHIDNGLIFASNLEAIRKLLPRTEIALDPEGMSIASRLGAIPAPLTVWRGIQKLEPGSTLKLHEGELSKDFYWSPLGASRTSKDTLGRDKRVEALEALLASSVCTRIPDEVPFGVFLSGGIDSALVAKFAADCRAGVPAFTMRFKDAHLDESNLAESTSNALNLDLEIIDFCDDDVAALWTNLGQWMDEPNFDSSIFATKHLSDQAAKKIRVALTGDGGDELFGGYPKYKWMDQIHQFAKVFPWLGGRSSSISAQPGNLARPKQLIHAASLGRAHLSAEINTNYFYEHELPQANQDAFNRFIESFEASGQANANWMDLDLKFYLEGILSKVDTAAMSASLETRSPFLDSTIYEFARQLPPNDLYGRFGTKKILRELAAKYIPFEVTHAPKKGFTPSRRRMIEIAIEMGIGNNVGNGNSAAETVLGIEFEKQQWRAIATDRSGTNDRTVWPILVLEKWLESNLTNNTQHVAG